MTDTSTNSSSDELLGKQSALRLMESITAIEGVKEMSRGRFGENYLLFAGERVPGFYIPRGENTVDVHVVIDLSVTPSIPHLAQEIQSLVAEELGGGVTCNVYVDDAQ